MLPISRNSQLLDRHIDELVIDPQVSYNHDQNLKIRVRTLNLQGLLSKVRLINIVIQRDELSDT